jgi:VIT1/CCC1 family predicted Fe2+/Mn2+ transporter
VVHRVLDPLDRTTEILFGIIMVLTFTGSISVAEGEDGSVRTVLAAAIGCNLAWGLVDATMYALAAFLERARAARTIGGLNEPGPASTGPMVTRDDVLGAAGVFLLVFLSTFPVILPLLLVRDTQLALRLSNAVAVVMLFGLGWSIGRYAGRPGWRSGVGMVAIGVVLVAITMALGG